LAACTSQKEVAEKNIDDNVNLFFAALEKQDFETAKKYVTPETQKILVSVEKDAQKYKEFNDKPQPIKVEILDRQTTETTADYKVRIIIGEKIKEEKIHCVKNGEVWLFEMPKEHIVLFKYVVFFDRYQDIIVLYDRKYIVKERVVVVHSTKKSSKKKSHKRKSSKKRSHKKGTFKGIKIEFGK
jgi:hypothetical protein